MTAGFIVSVRDAVQFSVFYEVGNILDKLCLVDAVRYLGNNNLIVVFIAFNLSLSTHHYTAATCLVCLLNALQTINICACWEVGSRYVLHQSLCIDIGIVDKCAATVNNFAKIMCRHIGSHTNGDTVTSIYQQVRYFRWHHAGLSKRVVKVIDHVDSILLQVVHDVLSHLREAALGITHSGWRVSVDRTEVSLSVNKCVAHVPLLSHAYQRSINRTVTMWVVLTKHLTYHACALLIRLAANVVDTLHTIEYASMHGLESVTHIWKRTSHDYRHRIVDIGGLHFLLDIDFDNFVLFEILILVHYIIYYGVFLLVLFTMFCITESYLLYNSPYKTHLYFPFGSKSS